MPYAIPDFKIPIPLALQVRSNSINAKLHVRKPYGDLVDSSAGTDKIHANTKDLSEKVIHHQLDSRIIKVRSKLHDK
jgi:hypothetical protein